MTTPVLLGAAVAAGWLAYLGQASVGVTPDSAAYIAAARSVAAGAGLVESDGQPFVGWPPLYPLVLAALMRTGLTPFAAAAWVNALALGGTMALVAGWVRRELTGWGTAVAALALVAIGVPVLAVAPYAWTEPMFVLFVVLALVALRRHIAAPSGVTLLIAALAAAAAAVTRYAGVALIGTGVLLLLVHAPRPRVALRDTSLFGTIASLPLAVWLARNLVVSGEATGHRAAAAPDVARNVSEAWHTLGTWLLPVQVPAALRAALVTTAVVLAAWQGVAIRRRVRALDPAITCPLTFVTLYVGLVLAAASVVRIAWIADRFLAPAAVPLLMLTTALLGRRLAGPACTAPAARVLRALLVLGVIASVPRAWLRLVARDPVAESTYNARRWRTSPLLAMLRTSPPRGTLLSSDRNIVATHTGLPVRPLPDTADDGGPLLGEPLGILAAELAGGPPIYLVVLANPEPEQAYSDREIARAFAMDTLLRTRDGVMYRLRPRLEARHAAGAP